MSSQNVSRQEAVDGGIFMTICAVFMWRLWSITVCYFKHDSPTRERDKAWATLGSELGLGPGEKEEGARVEGDRPCPKRVGTRDVFSFSFLFFFLICKSILSSNSRALNCSNKFVWRNDQHQSFRSQWVVQLCCCSLFHLKSFYYVKILFEFIKFWNSNVKLPKWIWMKKWPISKL